MSLKFYIEDFTEYHPSDIHARDVASRPLTPSECMRVAQKKHDEYIKQQPVVYGYCKDGNREWWNRLREPCEDTHTARLVNIEEIKK